MKKTILFIGVLSFLLMTMPSYAQQTSKVQKESKAKTEKIQNNPAAKVKERGISTPDHIYDQTEEKSIAVPDYWHKPNSKTKIKRIPSHLYFNHATFQIKPNKNGVELSESGSSSIYAKLVPTPKEGLYRYISSTKNGAAHFDAKGNLILKYLDNDTGKMKEIYFQSK